LLAEEHRIGLNFYYLLDVAKLVITGERMIEQILPELYRMEIPLPGSPLKAVNSYLIKGEGRFLIIDTGMKREECQEAMFAALKELNVDLRKTDFFITHLHADHLGLVALMATNNAKVYFSRMEAQIINRNSGEEDRLEDTSRYFISHGYPEDVLKLSVASHPGRRYGLRQHIDFSIVKEGDKIDVGDYSFQCIETPGHSPCHMCLYEPDKKLLLSGDHILADITPNISYWGELENPLKKYLTNLDKVYPLDVSLTLPGHRSLIKDHRKRIGELKAHHQDRVKEVLFALESGAKTAYQVAPYIKWDIKASSWEQFPAAQKWFAFGETLAHLIYMEKEGMVQEKKEGNRILFHLA